MGNIMEDPETGLESWFYAKKSAFGPNGWDKLVGETKCYVIEDADHFSMLYHPKYVLNPFLFVCLNTSTLRFITELITLAKCYFLNQARDLGKILESSMKRCLVDTT